MPESEHSEAVFGHKRTTGGVFHFLTEEAARARYLAAARRALKPCGHVVFATFGPAGPNRCSGLEVMRYCTDELHGHFGGTFQKLSSFTEVHRTQSREEQEFVTASAS